MSKDIKWIEKKHADNCYAVKNTKNGSWDHPWYFPEEYEYRDTPGRRGQGIPGWARVYCNCTFCPAAFLVRWSVIEDMLAALGEDT